MASNQQYWPFAPNIDEFAGIPSARSHVPVEFRYPSTANGIIDRHYPITAANVDDFPFTYQEQCEGPHSVSLQSGSFATAAVVHNRVSYNAATDMLDPELICVLSEPMTIDQPRFHPGITGIDHENDLGSHDGHEKCAESSVAHRLAGSSTSINPLLARFGSPAKVAKTRRSMCTTCKKTFSRESHLRRHAGKHTAQMSDTQNYLCLVEGCTYRGNYRLDKVRQHVRNRHPECLEHRELLRWIAAR